MQEADPLEADSADSQSIPRKEKFHEIIRSFLPVFFDYVQSVPTVYDSAKLSRKPKGLLLGRPTAPS